MTRNRRLRLVWAAAIVPVLAGCADNAPAGPAQAAAAGGAARSCFYARDIESWAPAGDMTVNLRVRFKDYYQLKLLAPCNNINWNEAIGIEHRGSSWICSGLDATVIATGPSGPNRCPAISVRKLTPEEAAALPRREKP
jgi:hypothetical protein